MKRLLISLFCLGLFFPASPAHVPAAREYAIILQDPPVARRIGSRYELRSARALDAGARIEQAQQELRRSLAERNIRVITSLKTLLNAVFVRASEEDAAALRGLPGVLRVVPSREFKLHLNTALPLVRAPQAWSALSAAGITNPGAGVKIAIIDTGIDQKHPAFQDSLPPAEGAPACVTGVVNDSRNNCAYTNSKVIVARSYVWMSAQGYTDTKNGITNPAQTSSPDDFSPRDRVGHGTAAAMIAAGADNQGPLARISGVAPKAYLGNYKVFGSPGVNDGTIGSAVSQALEDAFNDGMDVASLSLGFPAWFSPYDKGAACMDPSDPRFDPNASCEFEAMVVETAVSKGMVVAISAGNDGDYGLYAPSLSTIHTPGIAPSAITVGASRNAHEWFSAVSAAGPGAPDNVKNLAAAFGNGPVPLEAFTAPLRDINGLGCAAISAPLSGAIALIQRGKCNFSDKVRNAATAGAVGVIFYCEDTQYCPDGGEKPFSPSGLASTSIPAVLVGKTSGRNLKAYAGAHSDAKTTLDPALKEYVDAESDTVASFSSRGPSIAPETALKPEVVAPGTNLYIAAQKYDTNGELYSPDGYTVKEGTSFSAPMAAGVAALVRQRNPDFTAAQVKSAIVNTATRDVQDGGAEARLTAAGAGKLNAEGAVRTNVTVEPATLAFGVLTPAMLVDPGTGKKLRITNGSNAALTLKVEQRDPDSNAGLTLSATTVAARQTTDVSAYLKGSLPAPGSYEGVITITGGAVPLRVPYQYLVGDGVPDNVIPVTNQAFDGTVNEKQRFVGLRLIDRYGVEVKDEPVTWGATGGAKIDSADDKTYPYGWAGAFVNLGPQADTYQDITATIGSGNTAMQYTFTAFPRAVPTISADGVVNGASWQARNGSQSALAPGSYISIFGSSLSDGEASFDWYLPPDYVYLPVSLAGVSVSFDSGNISVPGHLSYVKPGQINVQIPWELQGQSSADMKVTLGDSRSAVYNIKLADAAPGIFEFDPYSTGRMWAAAQHPTSPTYTDIGPSKPARKGEVIVVWANGLGPTVNQPASGDIAPSSPLAKALSPVTVTIGGKAVNQIDFAGLSPNFIGLYQINLKVPDDAPSGMQDIVLTVNGNSSKPAKISIQ